ncbi:hypothetical protein MBRA_03633 [Methylobacterium brachiatum]|jgi:hypothetical protein|nr:hypothetical protein MBRA_03633 [Methylobacterium brachiatum]
MSYMAAALQRGTCVPVRFGEARACRGAALSPRRTITGESATAHDEAILFTRGADGTLLQRHRDGAFRPVVTRSDRVKLAALTDEEIERMGASDPDHPSLDDAFWEQATQV